MAGPASDAPELIEIHEFAARLQSQVPGAVLVGGTAAAWHARHRVSHDHDHGIEAGVRQLIRTRPLEVEEVELPSGAAVTVPTLAETLRIKAFLIVKRNQVRYYLDVAALSDRMGSPRAAAVLARVDDYYADQSKDGDPVATQIVRQLGHPRPRDTRSLDTLARYRGLAEQWQDWAAVTAQCALVAAHMLADPAEEDHSWR